MDELIDLRPLHRLDEGISGKTALELLLCAQGGFLLDTHSHSPTQIIVITGVRRGQGSARETLRPENPERGPRPGFLSFSLILGSRPYGGVSGDRVPYSQLTNGSNISVGGWGLPSGRPKPQGWGPAHCHIPLCLGATDLYFGICKWIQRASG